MKQRNAETANIEERSPLWNWTPDRVPGKKDLKRIALWENSAEICPKGKVKMPWENAEKPRFVADYTLRMFEKYRKAYVEHPANEKQKHILCKHLHITPVVFELIELRAEERAKEILARMALQEEFTVKIQGKDGVIDRLHRAHGFDAALIRWLKKHVPGNAKGHAAHRVR
jgi:hypothetical protein